MPRYCFHVISVLVLVSFLLLLNGCIGGNTTSPKASPEELARERQRQEEMVQKLKNEKNRLATENRKEMETRMLRVAVRIQAGAKGLCQDIHIAEKECNFTFKLDKIKDDEKDVINAYADGKTIVITPAMMNFTNSDDELALVLGHEFAHNLMGHVSASQVNTMAGAAAGFALDMLAASVGYNTNAEFMRGGAQLGALHYSKEFESEADYVGLYIMARAGYDYAYATGLWRRMSVEFPDNIYTGSTHPTNPERYVALNKTVDEVHSKQRTHIPLIPEIKDIEAISARKVSIEPASTSKPLRRK